MNELEIQCLPDDLPEYIEVDLDEHGAERHAARQRARRCPKGVEPVSKLKHENPAVVSVHVPKEIVIEEEAAAPVTEIIGEVPAEGEAAAEAGAEGEKKEAAAAAEEGKGTRRKKE